MVKHYIYRMDHDTGFAPKVQGKLCTLSGCKKNTIEIWAKEGSWVIGLGGFKTGKPGKIIYAMMVAENLPYRQFRKYYPGQSKYLTPKKAGSNVLISRLFYYLGDRAIGFPKRLKRIFIGRQGCKCVSEVEKNTLIRILERRYKKPGKIGKPNNPRRYNKCGVC